MFIANALYKSDEFGSVRIAITTEPLKSPSEIGENSIHLQSAYYKWPIAQEIMRVAATKPLPAKFICNEVKYTLLSYSTNNEERFYNEYRSNYAAGKITVIRQSTVFIYRDRCRCSKCYDDYGFDMIENYCGFIKRKSPPFNTVKIDIQKCKTCNKYFLDAASLKQYEGQHGKLDIVCRWSSYYESEKINDSWYSPNSILSRNGYSAQLSETARRRILVSMLERGISKAEIKDKLTFFINDRGDRCYMAVHAWRDDLDFVSSYNLNNQDTVFLENGKH